MARFGLVVAALLLSARARAAEASFPVSPDPLPEVGAPASAPFRVLVRGCPAIAESDIERMLAAELAADSRPPEVVREPSWIVVSCVTRGAVLEVHDARSGNTAQRRLEFGAAGPKAQARLIAIAAAELVSGIAAEFSRPAAPAASPVKASAPRKSVPVEHRGVPVVRSRLLLGTDPALASEGVGPSGERILYGDYVWERLPARTVYRIVAFGSARRFVDRGAVFWGGGVRFGSDLYPLHAWAIDALVETGTLHRPREGPLYLESWTVGGSLGWVFELGSRFTMRAGGGLRAGVVRTREPRKSFEPERPPFQVGIPAFWGWPFATSSGTAQFGRVLLELTTEGGYAAIPVGPGAGSASVRGVWWNVQFGVGLQFSP
jgi:hypothetical protein